MITVPLPTTLVFDRSLLTLILLIDLVTFAVWLVMRLVRDRARRIESTRLDALDDQAHQEMTDRLDKIIDYLSDAHDTRDEIVKLLAEIRDRKDN